MSTIITRSTGANPKGAPLTAGELDQNFINLNADKVESTRAINTTAGDLTGGGDLSGDRTLGLASTGITAGTVNNSTTQITPLTLDAKGRVVGVGTPQTIAPAFSSLTSTPTTLAGYGITDAQATITGAATTIDSEDLTASRALASDASGKVAVSAVTATELGYLSGVSSAVQTQLDGKQATSEKNQANGYAGLDSSGKLSEGVLPDLAISEYLGEVADETAMLALTGQEGDWCSRTDLGTVFIITGNPASTGGWMQLSYPGTPVKSVAGKTGVVTLVKGDVGLGNVDNTSDADKNSATVTLTNKTISGASNTLSNIANSSLTNSSVTIGSTSVSLGGTAASLSGLEGVSTTTLSASSTVTLSGGTANGVAYLNGSKVLTTGSALTFDGSRLGVTGTTPSYFWNESDQTTDERIWDVISGSKQFSVRLVNDAYSIATNALTITRGTGTNIANIRFLTGSGTDALRIDSTGAVGIGYTSLTGLGSNGLAVAGNVGIGTSSPTVKVQIVDSAPQLRVQGGASAGQGGYIGFQGQGSTTGYVGTSAGILGGSDTSNDLLYFAAGSTLNHRFYTNSTERMRIDSSGNLGLGVTPSATVSDFKALELGSVGNGIFGGVNGYDSTIVSSNAYIYAAGVASKYASDGYAAQYQLNSGAHYWLTAAPGAADATILFNQAMTLTAAGNLLVGDTSTFGASAAKVQVQASGISEGIVVRVGSTSYPSFLISFQDSSSSYVGSISHPSVNTTAYNTSSDYRLKENVQPIQNALSRVSLLKPSTYNWIADGSDGEGFIAHELQEVVPQAVSGEKDGEQMQGVDYGKLTPLLAAAIQELSQEIESLKAKVN